MMNRTIIEFTLLRPGSVCENGLDKEYKKDERLKLLAVVATKKFTGKARFLSIKLNSHQQLKI